MHQGVQKLQLVARHGQIGDSGQVRRERIDVAQIPKDKDNCGGLADVVEVSTHTTVWFPLHTCHLHEFREYCDR